MLTEDSNAPAKAELERRTRPARWAPRPEWAFVALAGMLGSVLALLTPPFEGPDEPAHFCRAYQVSEGVLIAPCEAELGGGYLPGRLI